MVSDGVVTVDGVPTVPDGASAVLDGPTVSGGVFGVETELTEALLRAGFAVLSSRGCRPLAEERARTVADPQLREIARLADRVVTMTRWARHSRHTTGLPIGYFACSTAVAVALQAAAELDGEVAAVVSSQGRPDLARSCVPSVTAATLLIVGGADPVALDHNGAVEPLLRCPRSLEIVSGASCRFAEPGALARVIDLAVGWFGRYLVPTGGEVTGYPLVTGSC